MTINTETSTTVTALLENIDGLFDLLQREAVDSERLHRPTPDVQAALKNSGVFQLMIPAELGGIEATPTEIINVIERVSFADASLGWLVRAITSETGYVAARLSETALTGLFDGDQAPLIAGQSTSFTGTARAADGGFRVSGNWQYAPGLSMATYVSFGVTDQDSGVERVCVVPRSQLRITDNWDTLGLRATATLDFSAEELFVPEEFTFAPGNDSVLRGGYLNRLSPALIAGMNQSAWSQGLGRRMLYELKLLTQHKVRSKDAPVTSDEFFAEFARHYSHVRGTMALLRETWRENEEGLREDRTLSNEQETMTRLAAALSTRTVLEISHLVHRFAGAQVMRNGTLQRLFRDGHAGTQHRGTAHFVTQQCGRMLTEIVTEGAHWGQFDLVSA